jgi:hypothetical protein
VPDLGPAVGGLLELFGPVLRVAFGALVRTVAGMIFLGVCVTTAVIYFSAQGSWLRGLIAAVLCLVALAIVTAILSVKNAALRGLLHGIEKLNLGGKLFTMVFDQLEDSSVDRAQQKVPLEQAEAKLRGAVQSVLGHRAQQKGMRGWLARKLLEAGISRVEAVTLNRFRSDQQQHGGVDLRLVRDELGVAIDSLIGRQVSAHLNRLNILIAGLYVVFAVVVGLLVAQLPV